MADVNWKPYEPEFVIKENKVYVTRYDGSLVLVGDIIKTSPLIISVNIGTIGEVATNDKPKT